MTIQAISLGVLIASAITITSVNDIFDDDIPDDSDVGRDRDRYRAVAGWLLFVCIAGIITQVIFAIVRGLFYGEVIISQFIAFGVVVSLNIYIYIYIYIYTYIANRQITILLDMFTMT